MKPIPSFWQYALQKIKWRINLTLWGESFLPLLFFLCALAALFFYLFRRWDISFFWLGMALIPLFAVITLYTYYRRRKEFFTARDTLAFLDNQLQLNTRLSLAYAGSAEWPDKRVIRPCLKWRSPWPFLLWPLASCAIISISLSVPLPAANTAISYTAPPPSLEQVEKWMNALSEMKELNQQQLEELKEKTEELLNRPKEEMYSHSALEAAESLKEQMDQEMKEFSQTLKRFQDALSSAPFDPSSGNGSDEQSLQSAIEAMEGKNLQLSLEGMNSDGQKNSDQNGKTSKQQKGTPSTLSKDKINQLSKEQLQNLKDKAQKAREQLQNLNDALKSCDKSGGASSGQTKDGMGPGSGAPTRGRGDAPLTLGKESPDIQMEKEKLLSDPNAQITLGEKVGETSGVFEVQDDGKRTSSGGKVGTPSSGGQATWEEQYTPAEKEALKNFFK